MLSFRMFRSPTTSSPSPSPDRCHHFSLVRLYSDKSVPSTCTDRVGGATFRSLLLDANHSPLATIFFRIRTYAKRAHNPFRIRTSKTQHLKPFRMNTSKKTGVGAPSFKPKPSLSHSEFLPTLFTPSIARSSGSLSLKGHGTRVAEYGSTPRSKSHERPVTSPQLFTTYGRVSSGCLLFS